MTAEANMTPELILADLSGWGNEIRPEVLAAADEQREALIESLLHAMENFLDLGEPYSNESGRLFGAALFLLAKWREPRAYPWFVRWLSMSADVLEDISGDTHVTYGGRLLAAVCGNDLEPIKALILDREAAEFVRSEAIEALALLAARGEVPRQEIVDYFVWLAREGLERDPSYVWNGLVGACVDCETVEVFPELRKAYEEGLADPTDISPKELGRIERHPGRCLRRFLEWHRPFDDVTAEIEQWAYSWDAEVDPDLPDDLDDSDLEDDDEDWGASPDGYAKPSLWSDDYRPLEPYKAPPKIGRNQPCPCGSGKKYKKCCGKP